MKRATAITMAAFVLVSIPAWAGGDVPERVTFTKDVLPILQENCQVCHRESGANLAGMVAPMSFTSYADTRPWAKAIAREASTRAMPPWHASEEFHGVFDNERTLTDREIDIIVAWAKTGAKRGNPADAPAPMKFASFDGWTIGKPDLVLSFDEPFFVEDEVEDLYQNIEITLTEEQLPESRWIKGLEFLPGSQAVHHIIAYARAPGEEGDRTRGMLAGMAPGTDAATFPDGYGILLKKGSKITFQMHYHKEAGAGTGCWDQSEMALVFCDEPVKPVRIESIAHGAFEIPPNVSNWKVGGSRILENETIVLAWMPHMHLRGIAAKYDAYYPDGTHETLLDVKKYDFNWQTSYEYAEPKRLPAGTRLEMQLWYDNSSERAEAIGFNANRAVKFGGPTTDEMDLAWFTFSEVEAANKITDGGD